MAAKVKGDNVICPGTKLLAALGWLVSGKSDSSWTGGMGCSVTGLIGFIGISKLYSQLREVFAIQQASTLSIFRQ